MAVPVFYGKTQFFDAAGVSLALGTVSLYVPGTTTPKQTWQDQAKTVLNTTPTINLDAGGYAMIYGSGAYRQIVKDVLGDTIWDQVAWATDVEADLALGTGAEGIGFLPDGSSAQTRTVGDVLNERVRLLDFVPLNLHADILAGTSTTDLSAYFQFALAYVESLPFGGTIFFPRGLCNMNMDCSKKVANDAIKVTLRGAGRGATTVKTVGSGAIGLNAVGRNFLTVEDMTIQSGGNAYCGIVLARNVEVQQCSNNNFRNVEVKGDFSLCAVASACAESIVWDTCLWWPTTGTPFMINGSDPAAPLFNLVVPGQTLFSSSNTDQHVINCQAYVEPADGTTTQTDALRLSGVHAIRFESLTIIATLTSYFIRYTDPLGGRYGANTSFEQSHFEGGLTTKAVHFVNVTPGGIGEQLQGVTDTNSTLVADGADGMSVRYLDYATRRTGTTDLLVTACRFAPGRNLGEVQTGVDFYCDILVASDIDYSCVGQQGGTIQGALCVFVQAENGSKIHAADTRCWKLVNSTMDIPGQDAVPTAGVFPQGAIVANSSVGLGDSTGWIALLGGSMDTDPGTYTCTTVLGSNVVVMDGDYPFYVGARVYIGDYGLTTIRDIDGRNLYMSNAIGTSASAVALKFSGTQSTPSPFASLGIAGLTQMPAQADSTASNIAGIVADFNTFLGKERVALGMDT